MLDKSERRIHNGRSWGECNVSVCVIEIKRGKECVCGGGERGRKKYIDK